MTTEVLPTVQDSLARVVLSAAIHEQANHRKYSRTNVRHIIRKKLWVGQRYSGDGRFVRDVEVWGCDISLTTIGFISSVAFPDDRSYWIDMRDSRHPDALLAFHQTRSVELVRGVFKCSALFVPAAPPARPS